MGHCCFHGRIHVLLGRLRTLGEFLARGGTNGREGLAVGGGDPLPPDEQLVLFVEFHYVCDF